MGVRLVGQEPPQLAGVVGAVCLEQGHQHRVVAILARAEQHRDGATQLVGQRMDLGCPPAAGTTKSMIGRFDRQILVIPSSPLWPGWAGHRPRVGARGCWWSPLRSCPATPLSLIHISEPTRRTPISYAVFC